MKKLRMPLVSGERLIQLDVGSDSLRFGETGHLLGDVPNCAAINEKTGEIIAIGHEAQELIGRVRNMKLIRPIEAARVAHADLSTEIIRRLVQTYIPEEFPRRPLHIAVGISCQAKDETKMAIKAVIAKATSKTHPIHREVKCIEQGIASLYGAGLAVKGKTGVMVVEIGGGTAEAVAAANGEIYSSGSVEIAGHSMDAAIKAYYAKKYQLDISLRDAEEAKILMSKGPGFAPSNPAKIVKGQYMITGIDLNKTTAVKHLRSVPVLREDIAEAIDENLRGISKMVGTVVGDLSQEMRGDLIVPGRVLLTGGGAYLLGLRELIEKDNEIKAIIADCPRYTVLLGCAIAQNAVFDREGELTILRERQENEAVAFSKIIQMVEGAESKVEAA